MFRKWTSSFLFLILIWLSGCLASMRSIDSTSDKFGSEIHSQKQIINTPTIPPIISPEVIPTLFVTVTPEALPEPEGCRRPPDDYYSVMVNGQTINARTFQMLSHAADIYGGYVDLTGWGITQGSYTQEEPLSFGTHAGGGAVDISVIARERFEILYDEIDPLIHALRVAGFAAWLRDVGELADYSPIHIHAIAIGDKELSQAARDQLTGQFGYFFGFNGVPTDDGIPVLDPHGGPIICEWMRDLGYEDLRKPSE